MTPPFLISYDLSMIDLESTSFDLRDYEIDYQEGGIADPLGQIANWIVSTVGTYISGAITTIGAGVKTIVNDIIAGTNSLISGVVSTANNIWSTIQSIPKTITGILANVEGDIMKSLSGITGTISAIVSQVTNSVSSGFNALLGSLNSGIASLLKTISGIPDMVSATVKNISSSISQSFTNITNTLSGIFAQINAAIGSAIDSMLKSIGPTLQAITSGLSDFGKTLGSMLTNGITQVISGVSALGAQLGASFEGILTGAFKTLTDTLGGFGKSISGLGAQIITGFQGLGVTQAIEGGFKDFKDFFTGMNFGKMITDAFSGFGSQLKTQFDNFTSGLKLPDLSGLGNFLTAFGSDPKGTIKTLVNDTLKTFGLPTIDQITAALPDFSKIFGFVSAFGADPLAAIGAAFKLPSEIADLFTSATSILSQLSERHSPNFWDNLISWFTIGWADFVKNANAFFNPTPEQKAASLKAYADAQAQAQGVQRDNKGNPIGTFDIMQGVESWLEGVSKTIFNDLQAFGTAIAKDMTDLGNYLVDGVISTFKLPPPVKGVTDPFGKLFSSMFQSFGNIAGMAKSSTPIDNVTVTNVAEGIAFTLVASEAIQWAGLGLDILHPIKSLQLRKKFKDFIGSIGLGHVTSVFGASLVAASLSPLLQRFWNKQSQVQLADPNSLIEMWHRDVFAEPVLDAYLSEHGYDQNFRNGLKENFLQIPQYAAIAEAYFKFMGDGKIDRTKAEQELSDYLDFFRLKGIPRSTLAGKFTFSERDIVYKLLYRGASRYERRALNLMGLLDEKTATNMIAADRVRPDLVPLMVKAERLQGSQSYRNQIETAIRTRVTKGFQVLADLGTALATYEYAPSAIGYITTAAQSGIQTTIDEARLKEADENYAQAVWDSTQYTKVVNDVIKNTDVAKEHIAISDIARQRNDFARVRDEGNLAISYELSAFAQGAVSADEFGKIASAMGKTGDEISRLETARGILLKNKTRTVKFGTLQYLLAKRQITRQQFVTHATKLPYDADLIQATADKVIAQAITKSKITPAVANEALFTSYPSVA